ncbi:sensor domain-containing diguanylate cyclase [Paenibacillus sp. 2TAB23]|uniref:sensor domain-containing diguanylate cyclase n=1 Tax=Paenibacillus sp. 2TAB23 TaxID=3233004 RepID=UPI003F999D1E
MSISLRTYSAITIIVLIIILTVFLGVSINKQSTKKIEAEVGDSLAGFAYQMSDKLDHYMWSWMGEINILSKIDSFTEAGGEANAQLLLDELKKNFPAYSWVGLTDENGVVKAATDQILVGKSIGERPVFKNALKETFIGDVHDAVLLAKLIPNASGEPLQLVDISTPVYDKSGNFKGVLAAHLSWEWAKEVQDTILKPLSKKEQLEVFIVAQDDTVLLGPDTMKGNKLNLASIQNARSSKSGWQVEQWPDGKSYLNGYAFAEGHDQYKGLGWTVIVRQQESIAYQTAYSLREYIVKLGIISAFVFALIGWMLAGNIAKPLSRLTQAADHLRNDEQAEIPYLRGIKEIEILSSSLRDLLGTLVKTESKLGKMEGLAHSDRLTGLPNRIAFDSFLPEAVKQVGEAGETIAVLFLDLDRFKYVNDTFGHHTGDLLLQEVANRLRLHIKGNEFLCRQGGDEFVMLMPAAQNTAVEDARMKANAIIKSLNEPFLLEGHPIEIGCSIGGAIWTDHSSEILAVVKLADEALYASKNNGKNRVIFYHEIRYSM